MARMPTTQEGGVATRIALDLSDPPPDFTAYLDALQAQEPDAVRAHAAAPGGQPWLLDAPPPDAALLRELFSYGLLHRERDVARQ